MSKIRLTHFEIFSIIEPDKPLKALNSLAELSNLGLSDTTYLKARLINGVFLASMCFWNHERACGSGV